MPQEPKLSSDQIFALRQVAEDEGRELSELLSTPVAELQLRYPAEMAFGLWRGRTDIGDGLEYQLASRDEWPDWQQIATGQV